MIITRRLIAINYQKFYQNVIRQAHSSNVNTKLKILFFGSDHFPLPVLKSLYDHHNLNNNFIEKIEIVTHQKSDKSKKVQNPIEQFGQSKQIQIHYPVGKIESKEKLKQEWKQFEQSNLFNPTSQFDLGIACSFGYLIPSYIIDKFQKGIIVIHPSLLPKYRGASPIHRALLNGDKETGVSFIEISKHKFDAGNILLQQKFNILPNFTYNELSYSLSNISASLIVKLLENLEDYRKKSIQQDDKLKTSAPKLTLEESFIKFKQDNDITVYNKFRAFKGTNFTTIRTKFGQKIFFLEQISLPNQQEKIELSVYKNANPGSIWILKNKLFKKFFYVRCQQNWIKIESQRPLDKKEKPAYKFIEQFIDKNKIFDNPNSSGHIFFED